MYGGADGDDSKSSKSACKVILCEIFFLFFFCFFFVFFQNSIYSSTQHTSMMTTAYSARDLAFLSKESLKMIAEEVGTSRHGTKEALRQKILLQSEQGLSLPVQTAVAFDAQEDIDILKEQGASTEEKIKSILAKKLELSETTKESSNKASKASSSKASKASSSKASKASSSKASKAPKGASSKATKKAKEYFCTTTKMSEDEMNKQGCELVNITTSEGEKKFCYSTSQRKERASGTSSKGKKPVALINKNKKSTRSIPFSVLKNVFKSFHPNKQKKIIALLGGNKSIKNLSGEFVKKLLAEKEEESSSEEDSESESCGTSSESEDDSESESESGSESESESESDDGASD